MSSGNRLRALLERRCASLRDEMHRIEQNLSALVDAGDHAPELLKETITLVHTVNGSCGSLGFAALSEAARKLEQALDEHAASERPLTDAVRIRQLFDDMQATAQQTTADQSRLYAADLGQLRFDAGGR